MAKVLPKFPPHNNAKYPWDEWLDGQLWQVKRGEDYAPPAEVFRSYIHRVARERGLLATVRKVGEDVLVIKAVKP